MREDDQAGGNVAVDIFISSLSVAWRVAILSMFWPVFIDETAIFQP